MKQYSVSVRVGIQHHYWVACGDDPRAALRASIAEIYGTEARVVFRNSRAYLEVPLTASTMEKK